MPQQPLLAIWLRAELLVERIRTRFFMPDLAGEQEPGGGCDYEAAQTQSNAQRFGVPTKFLLIVLPARAKHWANSLVPLLPKQLICPYGNWCRNSGSCICPSSTE